MGAKKKIAIEEVDSSAEAAKPKAKKKIAIEEVDSSAQAAPASPPKSPPATGGARAVPAFLGAKVKPPPKTGYEFERNLEGCKTPAAAAEYLGRVKPSTIPKLLKQNLTVEIMMGIMAAIANGLPEGKASARKWLEVLPKVNRFDIIVDFMSYEEKSQVQAAFTSAGARGGDYSDLISVYKLA